MNYDTPNGIPSCEAMYGNYSNELDKYLEAANGQTEPSNLNWVDNVSVQDRSVIATTIRNCASFINEQNLYAKGVPVPQHLFDDSVGCESINPNFTSNAIGVDKIVALCHACGTHPHDVPAASRSIINLLAKMSHNSNSSMYRTMHFGEQRQSVAGQSLRLTDLHDILPASLHSSFLGNLEVANEYFGSETDRVVPDIRVSMAVTLLRFQRGILDRIMHRRTSPSTVIKYVIPYAEVYDLMRSKDPNSQVRNGKIHRVPFLDLYGDPKVVSNTLRPIVVKKVHDTNRVVRDGVLAPNLGGNLMDLSRVAGEVGNNHTDSTDLIADGVKLDRIFITLTKDGRSEEFEVITRSFSKARLHMETNTLDSGNRSTVFTQSFKFSKERKTTAGADSQLLKDLPTNECIELGVRINLDVNLKFHDYVSMCMTIPKSYSSTNAAPSEALTTLMKSMTYEITGLGLDAKYSEENLRKSNVAIRSHYRTMDWEIPVGRNYIVDYAMQQALPEYLMANVTEAISLGQDHLAIDMIVKTLMDIYDRGREENGDPNFRETLYKLGMDFVAGQQVRPIVYLASIDLEEVDTIRSSDILGDIRQYVELQLINIFSLLHQSSYYKTQLRAGEKPVYKCVTSCIILENLLNVPHIHDHLMSAKYGETADGDLVEYRRVLPSGVVLECVTSTFDYMRDKMVVIPYRPNDPESVLNFAHNWDYGTYLAHYNPQLANGVNKRVFANAREIPLVTNGLGAYIEVKNISKVINMFHLVNSTSTSGDDLPDLKSRLPNTDDLSGPGNSFWHTKPGVTTP